MEAVTLHRHKPRRGPTSGVNVVIDSYGKASWAFLCGVLIYAL